MRYALGVALAFTVGVLTFSTQTNAAACTGYAGPGGPCYAGPGGGLYKGPGGGAYTGPGGGAYAGPGGPCSNSPGARNPDKWNRPSPHCQ